MTAPAADLFSDGVLLRVSIPGEPVAQGRPKFAKWRSKDGREGMSARDPEKSRNWKAIARETIGIAAVLGKDVSTRFVFPSDPLTFISPSKPPQDFPRPREEPLGLIVNAFFSCRKSDERKTRPTGRKWRTARPDADNIAKIVKDAATGILWLDDSQVVELIVRKISARQGEAPRVEITVFRVDEQPSL